MTEDEDFKRANKYLLIAAGMLLSETQMVGLERLINATRWQVSDHENVEQQVSQLLMSSMLTVVQPS